MFSVDGTMRCLLPGYKWKNKSSENKVKIQKTILGEKKINENAMIKLE